MERMTENMDDHNQPQFIIETPGGVTLRCYRNPGLLPDEKPGEPEIDILTSWGYAFGIEFEDFDFLARRWVEKCDSEETT